MVALTAVATYLVIVVGERLHVPGVTAFGTGAILKIEAADEETAVERAKEQLDPSQVPIGEHSQIVVTPYPA